MNITEESPIPLDIFSNDSWLIALLNIRIQLSSTACRELPLSEEEKQIASHLRTVFCIPNHREYIYSGHPSEPLVAEAAAQLIRIPENIRDVLQGLAHILKAYTEGEKGSRGELFSRLLLTAAHDRAALEQWKANTDTPLQFTRPIKVIDFLKALISEEYHTAVLECLPEIHQAQDILLKDAFKNAYISFTHFIKAEDNSVTNTSIAWQALVRSVAIQCCKTQENIDIVIPIVFSSEGPDKAMLEENNVSAILIQVKNRKTPEMVNVSADKIHFFATNTSSAVATGTEDLRPFIAIVMELGEATGHDPKPGRKSRNKSKPAKVNYVKVSGRESGINTRGQNEIHPKYNIEIHGIFGVYKDIANGAEKMAGKVLELSDAESEYPFNDEELYVENIISQRQGVGKGKPLIGKKQ